jgi:DNA primase
MDNFKEIKAQYSIESFIQTVTHKELKKAGSALTLDECPIPGCRHKDCFRIFPGTRTFKCFSCGSSGDLFSFASDFLGIQEKYELLKKVAGILNHELTNSKPVKKQSNEIATREKIFNLAAEFYNNKLLDNEDILKVLSSTRKYTTKTVKEFKLGYTGDKGDELLEYLKNDFTDDQLLQSGLFKLRKNKIHDYFVPKLFVFPHFAGKQVCDFTIKDAFKHEKKTDKVIDYRLEAEKRLCKHSFYNPDALYFNEIILTEGQHDAIQLMRYTGNKNVLAYTGNPSEASIKQIVQHCQNKIVYLAFDQDPAGDKYRREIFYRLWGAAQQISNLGWDAKAKDLDEYLRTTKGKPKEIADELIQKASDGLSWLISRFEDSDDISKNVNLLSPLKERALKINDSILFAIALEHIGDHFKKGKVIANILQKQFEKEQLEALANTDYLESLPYYEKNGCYYKKAGKGPTNLSNFRLTIKDIVIYDDEITYRCDIKSVAGEIARSIQFIPVERVDVKKFRTRCVASGAFHFTGKDADLSGIWQYEESKMTAKQIRYIQHYGRIQTENDMWLFDNCAIQDGEIHLRSKENDFICIGKKHYLPYDVNVYSGAKPKINIETPYSTEFAQNVGQAFHYMMDSRLEGKRSSFAGYLLLGFMPAIVYSDEIYKAYGFFPFLFSYGPPNTGKTAATGLLFSFFGFPGHPESWSSATEPGTYQFIQQLSSMPCWYDEFLNDKTFKSLLGTIKNIYNRTGAGKGGLKERRTVRQVKGVLWLSGEDNPANEAVLSRSVLFRFTPINKHKTKSYNFLVDNRNRLSCILRNLLLEKTEEKARQMIRQIDTYTDYILEKRQVDPRSARNHAIPAAALQALDIDIPDGFDEYLLKHVSASTQYKEEENPRNHFFSEVNHLYMQKMINGLVEFDEMNNELLIRFNAVIKIIQGELRKRGSELKIKPGSIEDYLKDMDGYMGNQRKYFTIGSENQQKRCMVFSYKHLPENIKESIDDIVPYEGGE